MDFLAGGFELVASYVIGNKKRIGFLLNLIGNSIWVYVAFKMHIYGLLLVVIPAMIFNVRNYRRWRIK